MGWLRAEEGSQGAERPLPPWRVQGTGGASRFPAVHALKAAREMRAGRSESGQVREE